MALILVQPGVMFKGSNELTRSPAKWPRVKDCSSSPARLRGLTREASEAETSAMAGLKEIGADVEDALERVRVPAYIIDRDGIIRWLNPAAQQLLGDVRGTHMTTPLAPEGRQRGHEICTRNLLGPPEGSDNRGILNAKGERFRAELSSVPLARGGHVIGVFGQVKDIAEGLPPAPHPALTPRQSEVLRLLERASRPSRLRANCT